MNRLPRDIISDLVEPLKILEKGYRIAFEPEAVAYEETTETSKEEFGMRVRVISRGMNGLWYMRSLFNPFKYGFISFQLFSHKVLRWMIPFLLPLLLVSNIFLIGKLSIPLLYCPSIVLFGSRYRVLARQEMGEKLSFLPFLFTTVW